MTFQQLEYFLAASLGSFSAAAEEPDLARPRCRRNSPPGGRARGPAVPAGVPRAIVTDAGATLRPEHAEGMLAGRRASRSPRSASCAGAPGLWDVGTSHFSPARNRRRVPPPPPRRARPVVGRNSSEIVEAVREGELEAGMVSLPSTPRPRPPPDHDRRDRLCQHRGRPPAADDHRGAGPAPLILPDATFGVEDPTRRQLNELAQAGRVRIGPTSMSRISRLSLELRPGLGRHDPRPASSSRWAPRRPGRSAGCRSRSRSQAHSRLSRAPARCSRPRPASSALAEERSAEPARVLGARDDRRREPGG